MGFNAQTLRKRTAATGPRTGQQVKVFVVGATGVMGRSVIRSLHSGGHSVVGLARDATKAETLAALDVQPVRGDMFDVRVLAEAFAGCDVVCNVATHVPVGIYGMRPGAWKVTDRIRSEGARIVCSAARMAGANRLIQESVSYLYADGGDQWIDEDSPVGVNRATEPVVLAEAAAEEFRGPARESVVLRFGAIIGDDEPTRWRLDRARSGHPVGVGSPEGWTHVVHVDDIGTAVVAALSAPSGIYNVGARPLQRAELARSFGEAVGRSDAGFMSRLVQRLGGERLEPLCRSQRVSSCKLAQQAAWKPKQPEFGVDWLRELVS
jgi:nucleoside-diphosphate-sugar epimerase